jgi:hypothetical protein
MYNNLTVKLLNTVFLYNNIARLNKLIKYNYFKKSSLRHQPAQIVAFSSHLFCFALIARGAAPNKTFASNVVVCKAAG